MTEFVGDHKLPRVLTGVRRTKGKAKVYFKQLMPSVSVVYKKTKQSSQVLLLSLRLSFQSTQYSEGIELEQEEEEYLCM